MLQQIERAILCSLLIFQISAGQNAFFNNDNPLSSGISGSNSGGFSLSFPQDLSSSAQLNKEMNYNIPTESSSSSLDTPSLPFRPSSNVGSTSEISHKLNPSPIELFISEFNSAVYSSKILTDVLNFPELSPEAYSKSLYKYVYAIISDANQGNPDYIAKLVASPLKEGIDAYTLPVILDIYGNTFAKYLFAKGTLNSFNAASLAKKYAKTMEDIAERKWSKDNPESKFGVLFDGFVAYIKSIDPSGFDWFEDIALQFANEVKRVSANF